MAMKLFGDVLTLQPQLDHQMERHNVLASNLANVETPGYRDRDLVFQDALDSARLSATDDRHIRPETTHSEIVETEESARSHSADGNAIRLEKTMAQIQANRVRYQASVEVVKRRLDLLKYAATDGMR